MDRQGRTCSETVETLLSLYDKSFGGKQRGRFRISAKLLCRIVGQRRIWPEQVEAIRRELYERGYLLVDLETYYAIVSQKTFAGYRRVNEASIEEVAGPLGLSGPVTPAAKTIN